MFSKLWSYATSGISGAIEKYVLRASVAVPFLFAFAFALAGLTVVLINTFGYRDAYFLLAGGCGVVGLIACVAVWMKERNDAAEEADGIDAGSVGAVASAALATSKEIPAAVADGTSDAASSFRGLADLAARNWPLVLAAGIAAILFGGQLAEERYAPRRRPRF